jgi:NAD-dependent dihydropyrimidine dehydrogenase PreA subunit
MWEVVVDKDKCNGDEECVDACPSEVFEEVCPEGAITVTEV